ncbi:DUF4233 domain-containing protein [Corynebacterium anserum]|uniref:DUF4233 domain-containing protein n=1 Tax=Corynebacterium anserum TaxID=2684406 RepID=A0A7G7YMK0_9CORY|nr:DUF4233 domain-containing protein [Corynebacterium anserum]
MMRRIVTVSKKAKHPVEMGPLGPGHAPKNDPMKGLRGVMAGTHIMEAIVILLVLTVVTRVDPAHNATTFNIVYVLALGVAMIAAAFMQKAKFADALNIVLQILAVVGFIVHISMGVVGLMFVAVWWYIYTLKRNIVARMERGLLPSQHID